MPKTNITIKLLAGAALGAAFWVARRVAYAPPDKKVAARAHDATRSGPWRHNFATVNGVRLHYAEVGSGPLVILLHGFPQCWYEWRYVIPRLAEHFHVVAPDMRGYNESDKPPDIGSYTIEALTQDIASLIEALGEKRAHIVGHDWGGGVAWGLGMQHSHRVDKLVVLNSPHPAAFERELKKGKQLLRSWYIFFFQLPLLPEASMRLTLRRSLPNSAQVPGAFSEEALDVYENGISQPGAATAMINYYRAVFRNAPATRTLMRPITRPTLLLWGMKDFALVHELTEGLEKWVPDLRIERVDESGHWLPEEKPGVVADALLDFLLN